MMRLLSTLVTIFTIVHADVVTSNSFNSRSSSFTSSGSGGDGKYYGQWTVGDLTCYIAQERAPDGSTAVVKQCRNGLLGPYHPMTEEEERIIEEEKRRTQANVAAVDADIARSHAAIEESMTAMNQDMDRYMGGANTMMHRTYNDSYAAMHSSLRTMHAQVQRTVERVNNVTNSMMNRMQEEMQAMG